MPAPLSGVSSVEVVLGIAEEASQGRSFDEQSLREPLALSMARSAAVGSSQALSQTEMESIVETICKTEQTKYVIGFGLRHSFGESGAGLRAQRRGNCREYLSVSARDSDYAVCFFRNGRRKRRSRPGLRVGKAACGLRPAGD